jgi:transposase InsO family protein
MAESFFGSLKTELLYGHSWASRHDAELAIFAWIKAGTTPSGSSSGWNAQPRRIQAAFYADPRASTLTQPSGLETLN